MKKLIILINSFLIIFTNVSFLTSCNITFRKKPDILTNKFIEYACPQGVVTTIANMVEYEISDIGSYFTVKKTDIVMQELFSLDSGEKVKIDSYAPAISPGSNYCLHVRTQIGMDFYLTIFVWTPFDDIFVHDEKNHVVNTTDGSWNQGVRTLTLLYDDVKIKPKNALYTAIGEYFLYYKWLSGSNFDFDQENFKINDLRKGDFNSDDILSTVDNDDFSLDQETIYYMRLVAYNKTNDDSFEEWQQADIKITYGNIAVKFRFASQWDGYEKV